MTFLPSIGAVLLLGFLLGEAARLCKLPPLIGMIFSGILLGDSFLGILGEDFLSLSGDLRKIALILILLKAGLTLQWDRLKSIGTPAFLLAFLPATLEIIGCTLFAPLLFPISSAEALLLGTVLAAVSPAVVVPRMVKFMEQGIGKHGRMPEIILAGASLDDVFVMVLFSSALSLVEVGTLQFSDLLLIPFSILSGLALGVITGFLLSRGSWFQTLPLEGQMIPLFGISCGFFGLEHLFPFSPLLAVMALGLSLQLSSKQALAQGFTSLWKGGEVILFVSVGGVLHLPSALALGLTPLLLLFIGLVFRSVGTFLSTLSKTKAQQRFAILSYLPKATVQAGIGGIPLAMGLDCGQLILTVAVLAILVTAPLGAWLIDRFGESCLNETNLKETA